MMKKAYRAIGQIEGVAFAQGELLRDLLMGAVDEIEEAMKTLEDQVTEMERTATEQTELVEWLMKQKDKLLAENARIKEMVEERIDKSDPVGTPRNDREGEDSGCGYRQEADIEGDTEDGWGFCGRTV